MAQRTIRYSNDIIKEDPLEESYSLIVIEQMLVEQMSLVRKLQRL
jgi:hypothetical protein